MLHRNHENLLLQVLGDDSKYVTGLGFRVEGYRWLDGNKGI